MGMIRGSGCKAVRRHSSCMRASARVRGRGFGRRCLQGASRRSVAGQMTIELAVAMPVLIAVAVISVNALTFFADCATFDRITCEAVRLHAAAPAYGQDAARSVALVEQTISAQMEDDNLEVSVALGTAGPDFDEFRATLTFHPTLFGMGLRSSVFGVALPKLTHETRFVIDSYKPGVIV